MQALLRHLVSVIAYACILKPPPSLPLIYHDRAVGVYTSNSDLYDLLDDNVFEAWQTHWLQQRKRTDVLLPSVPVNDRHGYYSHCWYRPDVERFNKCVLEASPQDLPMLLDDMERVAAARAEVRSYLYPLEILADCVLLDDIRRLLSSRNGSTQSNVLVQSKLRSCTRFAGSSTCLNNC